MKFKKATTSFFVNKTTEHTLLAYEDIYDILIFTRGQLSWATGFDRTNE